MAPWTAVVALLFAFCLDRWFGEPAGRWHPVHWMHRFLGFIGGHIAPREAPEGSDWRSFWAGALAWYGGAMAVFLVAYVLEQALIRRLPQPWAGVLLGALLEPMVSWRRLRDGVVAVDAALAESLPLAQRELGRLAPGEVMQLDEAGVRASALGTLAREVGDGVVAPVFWFALFGLPGAVVYRFASTAAASWGYSGFHAGSHWQWAGKWALLAGAVVAWVPARINALLIALLARRVDWQRMRELSGRDVSPHDGWGVAALAHALDRCLRKSTGQAVNATAPVPSAQDTARALQLADRTVAVTLAWTCLLLFVLGRAWPA